VTPGTLLWFVILVILVWLFVIMTRRMSVLVARTRDLEDLQRTVDSIDRRLAAASGPLIVRLDEIRRHAGDPQALAQDLGASLSMLEELASETRALRLPAPLAGPGAVMVHEVERAVRAAELVAHGLDALVAGRGNRQLEAETSLKRGTLNLRHSRDAFGRAAAQVASMRPSDLAPSPGDRGWGAPPPSPAVPAAPDDNPDEDS
jgi:hypothetical protein